MCVCFFSYESLIQVLGWFCFHHITWIGVPIIIFSLLIYFYFNINLQFFPKTEKYVSLFMGGDEAEIVEKRNSLRKQIKANLISAAANGKELEGTLFSNFYK